jgi:hypothetical protein
MTQTKDVTIRVKVPNGLTTNEIEEFVLTAMGNAIRHREPTQWDVTILGVH